MLLVLTEPADVHADHLIDKLRARDADVVRFNPADYPARAELSLTYSAAGRVNASLRADGLQIDFREVSAVWWRRPRAPRAHADIVEPRTRTYVEQESKSFTQDAWTFLDCPWLPGPPNVVHKAEPNAQQ